ncbi:MAG TPA: hypothetical protein VGK43_01355 [Solirubrobacterales bacterium]
MAATGRVEITITELPQFRRLVRFFQDIESLGWINGDDEIQALVNECQEDLLAAREGETGD